jgi:putative transposase
MTQAERSQWIKRGDEVPLAMQCKLAGVPRSSVYRRLGAAACVQREDAEDLKLRELIDEQYTSRPFYGSRRMVECRVLRVRGRRSHQESSERSH